MSIWYDILPVIQTSFPSGLPGERPTSQLSVRHCNIAAASSTERSPVPARREDVQRRLVGFVVGRPAFLYLVQRHLARVADELRKVRPVGDGRLLFTR